MKYNNCCCWCHNTRHQTHFWVSHCRCCWWQTSLLWSVRLSVFLSVLFVLSVCLSTSNAQASKSTYASVALTHTHTGVHIWYVHCWNYTSPSSYSQNSQKITNIIYENFPLLRILSLIHFLQLWLIWLSKKGTPIKDLPNVSGIWKQPFGSL